MLFDKFPQRKIAGVSYRTPKYTIKDGDGLYFIATEVFSGLLQYEKIQAANKILNPNVIEAGDNLTIPLPCSCDDVGGGKVVHYAHVVEAGSSFDSIAERFGSDKDTLMRINGIDDEKKLMADQPIDVPLRGKMLLPFGFDFRFLYSFRSCKIRTRKYFWDDFFFLLICK